MISSPSNQLWSNLPSAGLWGGVRTVYSPPTAGGPAAGSAGGIPSTGYNPAYGGIPTVPDPNATAGSALAGNISRLPQLEAILAAINSAQSQSGQANLRAGLPGYDALQARSSRNIESDLAGTINPDVLQNLSLYGAQRGVSGGFGVDSPNANAAVMRALGLTSMGLQQQGQQELTGAISRVPQIPYFNPSGLLVTPEQSQEAAMAQSLYNSAPNPAAAAAAAKQNALEGYYATNPATAYRTSSYAPGFGGGYQPAWNAPMSYSGNSYANPPIAYGPGGGPGGQYGATNWPTSPMPDGYGGGGGMDDVFSQMYGGSDWQNYYGDEGGVQMPESAGMIDPSQEYGGSYEDYYGY